MEIYFCFVIQIHFQFCLMSSVRTKRKIQWFMILQSNFRFNQRIWIENVVKLDFAISEDLIQFKALITNVRLTSISFLHARESEWVIQYPLLDVHSCSFSSTKIISYPISELSDFTTHSHVHQEYIIPPWAESHWQKSWSKIRVRAWWAP